MKIIITERQEDLLMKGLPAGIRRRLNYNTIKDHLDFSILESINPCDYSDPGDFISEMCSMVVGDILYDFEYENKVKVSSKDKDEFYYFMNDNFADYLRNFYNKQCA
jgi:hypothetical protein